MVETIPLSEIKPNPYQPREKEDPEHVKKIALSIVEQGLLQTPVGRRVNGHVELAFGHTRLAAFKWLVDVQPTSNLVGDWSAMPVIIQDLDDQQMFEQGISENLARKDLTPIEEARAMKRYREDFGKTSAEIGRLFGLSESAVRNKIRLLDLPDNAQEQLATGQITEGAARQLLTLQRVVPKEMVSDVAEKMATNPDQGRYSVQQALSQSKQTVEMWQTWRTEAPRGGSQLWPLDWKPDAPLDPPTFNLFSKLYQGPETVEILYPALSGGDPRCDMPRKYTIKEAFNDFLLVVRHELDGSRIPTVQDRIAKQAPDAIDLLRQLMTPPACTSCSYYARLNGAHYCGLKPCWERKRAAWGQKALAEMAEKLGISVYDPEQDGKVFEQFEDYYSRRDLGRKWFKERKPFLRLRIKFTQYDNNFTNSSLVQVISVGPESIKFITQAKDDKAKEAAEDLMRQQQITENNQRCEQSDHFLEERAIPIFVHALKPLSGGVIQSMAATFGRYWIKNRYDFPEGMSDLEKDRWFLIAELFAQNDEIERGLRQQGPVVVARHLMRLAGSWGVDLPADWIEQAQKFAGELSASKDEED